MVEFLVLLAISILMSRAFAAEAYIVPTGSMAPTLLGMHRDLLCPNCGFSFPLGMDEQGHSGRPICPNCGHSELEQAPAADGYGDRLLVQKYLFDWRSPRRWEVIVFQNPQDSEQAYVKRVVGLPGESVEIRHGDIYIDGQIARKSLTEQRAMRIPVYDNDFLPHNADRFPRWVVRRGNSEPSAWRPDGTGFVRMPGGTSDDQPDWIEYRHWQPERMVPGPIRDFIAYNGEDGGSENRVNDLFLEASIATHSGCKAVLIRIGNGTDRYLVRLPLDGAGLPEVEHNGRDVPLRSARKVALRSPDPKNPTFHSLEASLFDQRLTVAVDGVLLFEPIDDEASDAPISSGNLLALGWQGGGGEVRGLRVFRDVFYTSALAGSLRQPFGVGQPYRLGPGEFFVLGDNSPVSNDSRFWESSPVVRADTLLGKPFLVHLPSQAVPLKVFGRDIYWIPDPREIRYIR